MIWKNKTAYQKEENFMAILLSFSKDFRCRKRLPSEIFLLWAIPSPVYRRKIQSGYATAFLPPKTI